MERQNRNLTRDECVEAVTLHGEGWSYNRIAGRLGVSHTTIARVIQRLAETGDHSRRIGQGRRRVTTPNQDRFLRISAVRQRFTTARNLRSDLQGAGGPLICVQSVRRRLREANLRPRIAARGPALTVQHRRARLNFANEHVNWLVADWERILWTDESRFNLYDCDRRTRVYRRPDERYSQCNFLHTTLYGGGSVMVWGGISLTGRTELVIVNGSLTSERYILEILEEHDLIFCLCTTMRVPTRLIS